MLFCRVGSWLCEELITCSGESYRMRVSMCDLETSKMRRPGIELGYWPTGNKCHVILTVSSCLLCNRRCISDIKSCVKRSACLWQGRGLGSLVRQLQNVLQCKNNNLKVVEIQGAKR
jgi:hypothetical protein